MTLDRYYYRIGPIVVGPVSATELQARVRAGQVQRHFLIRAGDDGEWISADSADGLFEVAPFPLVPAEITVSNRLRTALQARRVVACIAATGCLLLGLAGLWLLNRGSDEPGRMHPARGEPDETVALKEEVARLTTQLANSDSGKESTTSGPHSTPNVESLARVDADSLMPPESTDSESPSLVAFVEQSVVQIRTVHADGKPGGTGSGFVADGSGIVATNFHVIDGCAGVAVVFHDGRESASDGFLVIRPKRDLALLHVKLPDRAGAPLALADDEPRRGEDVWAFGSPLGLRASVSDGIVSGVRSGQDVCSAIQMEPEVFRTYADLDSKWIQTTAAISPGNSGGPLVDARRRVVGLNTIRLNAAVPSENINFAIAASEIREILDEATSSAVKAYSALPPRTEVAARGKPADSRRNQAVLLYQIHEQRLLLLAQQETVQSSIRYLRSQIGKADAHVAACEQEAIAAQHEAAIVNQRANSIRAMLSEEESKGRIAALQVLLQQLADTYTICAERYRRLEASAVSARAVQSQLLQEQAVLAARSRQLREQSEQVRAEWLKATDVFGQLVRGDYDGAITAFTEWIIQEPDSVYAFIVRGIAHQAAGHDDLAKMDFQKATSIDPQAVAAIIREWQRLPGNRPKKQ